MRGWATLALAAGLLSIAPAVPAAPVADPHVTDPEGDAREHNSEMVTDRVRRSCNSVQPLGPFTCDAADDAGAMPQPGSTGAVGGVPAPAALDVIAAWFEETPTHLIVHGQVAALDESFSGIRSDDEIGSRKTAGIAVAWGDPRCETRVDFFIDNTDGERKRVGTGVERENDCTDADDHPWGGRCNAGGDCGFPVEREIEFGAPATIKWKVPRVLLVEGGAGATLESPRMFSYRLDTDNLRSGAGTNVPASSATGIHRAGVRAGTLTAYQVDLSEPGRSFTFATPIEDIPAWSRWDDPHPANTEPRADLQWAIIEESPRVLSIKTGIGQVDEMPGDAYFAGAIGLPSGHIVGFSVTGRGEGGSWGGYANYLMPYYDRIYEAYAIVVPAKFEVVAGTPGEIHVTFDRATLPFTAAGGFTTSLVLQPGVGGNRPSVDTSGVPRPPADPLEPSVNVAQAGPIRAFWEHTGLPSYRFLHDTPLSALEGVVRIEDAVADAQLPELATQGGSDPNQFDITYIEGRAVAPDMLHLTIGVRDLSSVAVPTGYHAVFYSFGLETAAGPIMAGYYKDGENPAGTFLCAHDTTVLAESPRDPTQGVWTILTGLVTTAAGASGSGSGGPGSITIHLPYDCIGATHGEDVTFQRFDAATYLIQNPTGRNAQGTALLVDEARSTSAVVIPRPVVEAPVTTVWDELAAPFGLQSFWDILGIGLAVAVATGGAGLKLRRRAKDKRTLAAAKAREDRDVYRATLQRAIAAGAADPARDEVLQALRRRLGISDREHAHYALEARAGLGMASGRLAEGDVFLGRYRVERRLGEGGFARAFLATDERLSRRVVLKVARWDAPEDARRALHEARILARMDHPRIVAIHDVEEVSGEVVLVLEHMPQGSLADKLREGPLEPSHALALIDDVLDALEAAHAQGVVHRDVKPANVLLTASGRAKLADFGIARGAAAEGTAADGSILGEGAGSLACMSPEQARGLVADARSDVYGVGALLYHALAGRPYLPFDRLSPFDARLAIIEDAPDLPLAGVPDEVNATLGRALAKDPRERPQDATQMRRMLARS